MAIVRYGSIMTELKGKIGGQVFQGGNTVPIFRNNYAGSNRKRYVSSTENVIMSKLAHEWQLLTNSERLSWTTYPITLFYDVLYLINKTQNVLL